MASATYTNGTYTNGTSHMVDGNVDSFESSGRPAEVLCGPLLNYKRMSHPSPGTSIWHGSVLVVTHPGMRVSSLRLRCLGPASSQPVNGYTNGVNGSRSNGAVANQSRNSFPPEKLYEDRSSAFWRYVIHLPLGPQEARWEYNLPNMSRASGTSSPDAFTKVFNVPSATESMRIMFHSCNGFSLGTDEDAWSGCALWNDVLRKHHEKPLHVMIGGGDQIYNDNIRLSGPLRPWCDIANPVKRRDFPFTEQLRAECDKHYFENYVKWYSTEPFASANGIIPQINIWDDHDIIDGFGSYTDHFMKCAVFRGIGGVAHKYYYLFQHHIPPPRATFTTDAKDYRTDPAQIDNTYVLTEKHEDSSFILGKSPGPYVEERSRSIYCELGAHVAFCGIDARTERTRHQINYPETYDLLMSTVSTRLEQASGRIKHFILLLGVPIAYPRLQWLENILTSPVVGVVRFLNKRFGVAGGVFNEFDGGVDLMDDLDDHYTAHQHKKERKELIHRLQQLAEKHSVRVTILGGDVHLAAFGRFYSKPSHENHEIDIPHDHRYMANIVSSAITNHPPPAAVANLLARRNKIHHLDHHTDETLLNLFDKDPGKNADPKVGNKTANANHCTMPSRNYAIIAETEERTAPVDANGAPNDGAYHVPLQHHNWSRKPGNPRNPLHAGEDKCGIGHAAAGGVERTGLGGKHGLDVTYRVEIDHFDKDGKTEGYGVSIPALDMVRKQS